MNRLRWLAILMGITILGITGFQGYWLHNNYQRERQNLEIQLAAGFQATVLELQASCLNLDRLGRQLDSLPGKTQAGVTVKPRIHALPPPPVPGKKPPISLINLLQEKMRQSGMDSVRSRAIILSGKESFPTAAQVDSIRETLHRQLPRESESIVINTDTLVEKDIRTENNGKEPRVITLTYSHTALPLPADTMAVTKGTLYVEKRETGKGPEIFESRAAPLLNLQNTVVRFLYNIDSISIGDSVRVASIDSAFRLRLAKDGISGLEFSVIRRDSTDTAALAGDPFDVTIGFAKPLVFHVSADNEFSYLLRRLTLPILFSLLLVGITVVSFVLLYRNLIRQRRLAELKNEFISNITHELKTPIATVGVAIEALANFNAMEDPVRTREYLAISQQELQRLGLLIDKVLKLSMFENKEMDLKKERFDCSLLVAEVMRSMRLQFEKYGAEVSFETRGSQFWVEADKLHITSVIYNLLDNALKYSQEKPVIRVLLEAFDEHLQFSVEDNGIGIEPAYRDKVFEKFFRVPTGNRHNTKGYGLGLSYVAEVVRRHQGQVFVHSEPGKGSRFTARFPQV